MLSILILGCQVSEARRKRRMASIRVMILALYDVIIRVPDEFSSVKFSPARNPTDS